MPTYQNLSKMLANAKLLMLFFNFGHIQSVFIMSWTYT